ncbi:MAG: gluconate 2-dehydrogenase subunit 3 family protein [Halobacteriales archaeon]
MQLTRRDAIAALSAAGVAVGGGAAVLAPDQGGDDRALGSEEVGTLVAAAEVLYPSAVAGVGEFVSRYARSRAEDRPDVAAGISEAVAYLDEYAEAWHDGAFAALDPSARADALRDMGADTAAPNPSGSDVERVRYYVVNELLFALYSTPTGGELVGIENPQGHPGGLASYRRGPQS